jgi:hypothetical protein
VTAAALVAPLRPWSLVAAVTSSLVCHFGNMSNAFRDHWLPSLDAR